jgi:hypothetical protein
MKLVAEYWQMEALLVVRVLLVLLNHHQQPSSPATRNQKPETRNQKLETINPHPHSQLPGKQQASGLLAPLACCSFDDSTSAHGGKFHRTMIDIPSGCPSHFRRTVGDDAPFVYV